MDRLRKVKKSILRKLSRLTRWSSGRRRRRSTVKRDRNSLSSTQLHCMTEPILPLTDVAGSCNQDNKNHSTEKKLERCWEECADLPVSMKNAQAVFFNDHLYIGGGHTGHSATDSIVFRFHPQSNTWEQLPPSPMKWFGLAVFEQRLVLVGGKEIDSKKYKPSNKIASWNEITQSWEFSLLPMTFTRASPVAFGYQGYLVVAGGKKGSLDFCAEVLDPVTKRWIIASSLPAKCSPLTSAISEPSWYLLQEESLMVANIHNIVLQAMATNVSCQESSPQLRLVKESGDSQTEIDTSTPSLLWRTLTQVPPEITQVFTVGDNVFVMANHASCSHLYEYANGEWRKVSVASEKAESGTLLFVGAGDERSLYSIQHTAPGVTKMYTLKLTEFEL